MYPQFMKIIGSLSILLCLILASACSMLAPDSASEQPQGESSETQAAAADDNSVDTQSGVEIVWEAPREEIDEFLIHFGYSGDNLDSVIRVPLTELEKKEDPLHGQVFKYVLGNIDPKRDLYVSLASVRQGETSPFSQIFEIKAAQ